MKSALELANVELGVFVYRQMRKLNVQHDGFTLPIVNQLYLMLGCGVRCANMVHCVGIHMGFGSDVYFCNTLMDYYVKCGWISFARKVFDEMPLRDLVSWTSMISGCVSEGNAIQTFDLFTEMRRELEPNFVTVITMLRACSNCWNVNSGRQFHGYVFKKGFLTDMSVKNSLLQMYTNLGTSEDVETLFSELVAIDIVAWNILISFYYSVGDVETLVGIFHDMASEVSPNVETLTLIASALSKFGSFSQGKQLHCLATKTGLGDCIFLTCLIDLYAKFGHLDSSIRLFSEIPCPSTQTWSTLMMNFTEHGQYDRTIGFFKQLQSSGIKLTTDIIESLLDLCVETGSFRFGKEIHGYYLRNLPSNKPSSILETGLLNMYIRCGSISSAQRCFATMIEKDIVAWTSMIEGLGTYGLGIQALNHFNIMLKEGIQPNAITFLSILSACSHSGLTHDGCKLLTEMKWKFGFNPNLNHYTCIVDLLGRSGNLKEALIVILKMVVFPDSRIWGALLSGSRLYNDRQIGEFSAKRLLCLEPDNIGYQIVFSNMQASVELWDEVEELRSTVYTKKVPGWSCIEANGEFQGFVSGDRCNPNVGSVYEILGFLSRQMNTVNLLDIWNAV